MAEISIGKADLKPGEQKCVSAGGQKLALCNIGGKYYAVSNECTHAGGPMCEGLLDAEGASITCPWHGSVFDARDGKVLNGPATAPLKACKVRESNGELFVRV
ncbi:MAG: non-heme iron oxygenase ferredoxin subunit [Candidatus Micrarchaeota archaeon]|nr:non-heme iron oxygenase ferredoxin subunit [Candidatus Micrarchaeota archaeon]